MAAVAVPVRSLQGELETEVVPAEPRGPNLPDSSGPLSSGLWAHAVFHTGYIQGHFSEE